MLVWFFFYKKYNYGYYWYKKYNYGYNFLNIYIEENYKNKRENSNPQKRNCQTEMVHCLMDFPKKLTSNTSNCICFIYMYTPC